MNQQLSDLGLDFGRRKRHRPRRGLGCLAVLLATAVLAGGAYAVYTLGLDALKDMFSPPPDYTGKGVGSVLVEVRDGDAATDIAETLREADVVKSTEAFTDAASKDPSSLGIQVGFYKLKHKMPAEAALAVLVNPDNLMQNTVAFPEGWTVRQIVAQLAKHSDFTVKQYDKVLRRPEKIGLPPYAGGNPEGYLFPATYEIKPSATPRAILAMMVDRYQETASRLKLEQRAKALGYSAHDVMTVASLIQAEARFDTDFTKVSRVIYNRLDQNMPLQFDSTIHYAVGRDGSVGTSATDREVDSPYNTYNRPGLPPTPITAPGDQAIEAALNPAPGPWLYFVTTNPDTGETKYATTYKQHLRNKAEFDRWCAQSEHC